MKKLTRRQFLQFSVASTVLVTIPVNLCLAAKRPAYVKTGDLVDYIGKCPGGFIGSRIVKKVEKWDGTGYPVILQTNYFPPGEEVFYDFDLYGFIHDKDIKDFWKKYENRRKYPNVHTFARVKRFGETREEAIRHLNFASRERFLKDFCNI